MFTASAKVPPSLSSTETEFAKSFASKSTGDAEALDGPDGSGEAVDDFLYSLMSESDLLTEVTNLVGKLRYAIEGGDRATAEESEMRIRAAGRFMPDNRRADLLADAAAGSGPDAEQLARLYLERAYGLLREDYRAVQGAEDQIKQLTGADSFGGPKDESGSTEDPG